jgi:putative transposase
VFHLLHVIKHLSNRCALRVRQRLLSWIRPARSSLLLGTVADLARSKSELVAENALLRQQLIILTRQMKRPVYTKKDRLLLVLLARAVRHWKQALLIIQPETLLRWHRHLFSWYWKHRSKPSVNKQPKIAPETVALIQTMARDNRLWGAERIRGELLKLGIHVSKRTIQKYMRKPRARPTSQTWKTFLHNHASDIWACDFLPVTDVFFRSLFALRQCVL